MGAVFQGRADRLGRTVAIKLLARELVRDRDSLARFHQEIQAVASLNHRHIVTALDADAVGDTHFLVMEYVPGTDLGSLLNQHGPPPVEWACECVRQAALGLQHAYEQGMVHRDIKPSNILVGTDAETGRPLVKILDLGLARCVSETRDDRGLTQTGQVLGTPDYISPEQAADTRGADIRSDLFSLGVSFFRLLTGRLPYTGNNVMEKLMARRCRSRRASNGCSRECEGGGGHRREAVGAGRGSAVSNAHRAGERAGTVVPQSVVGAVAAAIQTRCGADRGPAGHELRSRGVSGETDHGVVAGAVAAVPSQSAPEAQESEIARRAIAVAPPISVEAPRAGPPPAAGRAKEKLPSRGSTIRTTRDLGGDAGVWCRAVGNPRGVGRLGRLLGESARARNGSLANRLAAGGFRGSEAAHRWRSDSAGARQPHGMARRSGEHRLMAMRAGYPPLDVTLKLSSRQPTDWSPDWETAEAEWLAGALKDVARRWERGVPADARNASGLRDQIREILERAPLATAAPSLAAKLSMLPWPLDELPMSAPSLEERRDKGWLATEPVPRGVVALFGDARLRHAAEVTRVATNPAGTVLASFGRDRVVRLWDPATGEPRAAFAHADDEARIEVSAGGGPLVGLRGRGIVVWNMADGIRSFESANLRAPARFSGDGARFAANDPSRGLVLCDVADPERQVVISVGADRTLRAVAWSADGDRLAVETRVDW